MQMKASQVLKKKNLMSSVSDGSNEIMMARNRARWCVLVYGLLVFARVYAMEDATMFTFRDATPDEIRHSGATTGTAGVAFSEEGRATPEEDDDEEEWKVSFEKFLTCQATMQRVEEQSRCLGLWCRLMDAVANSDEQNSEQAEQLLREGATGNKHAFRVTPVLLVAARHGRADYIKMLLAYRADPNVAHRRSGKSPLREAVGSRNEEAVRLLLAAKARVDVVAGAHDESLTPLIKSAADGTVGIAEMLLQAHADINMPNGREDKITPLIAALGKGDRGVPMVQLLIARKADVFKRDGRGRLPMTWAINKKCKQGQELLWLAMQQSASKKKVSAMYREARLQCLAQNKLNVAAVEGCLSSAVSVIALATGETLVLGEAESKDVAAVREDVTTEDVAAAQ